MNLWKRVIYKLSDVDYFNYSHASRLYSATNVVQNKGPAVFGFEGYLDPRSSDP